EEVRREQRLYKCWSGAKEIELEVDSISFSYEREALAPQHDSTGGTEMNEQDQRRENQKNEVRKIKAKTTESLAKSAIQLGNSNLLTIRGYRSKLVANNEALATGTVGQELED
ncbi:unnamed protein product, partial [Symbiodinium sp. CCMP2592]